MGALVTTDVEPGMPHTVNKDELDRVRAMMDAVSGAPWGCARRKGAAGPPSGIPSA